MIDLPISVLLSRRTVGARDAKYRLERHLKSLLISRDHQFKLISRYYDTNNIRECTIAISPDGSKTVCLANTTYDLCAVSIYDNDDLTAQLAVDTLGPPLARCRYKYIDGFQFYDGGRKIVYSGNSELLTFDLQTVHLPRLFSIGDGYEWGPFRYHKNNMVFVEKRLSYVRILDLSQSWKSKYLPLTKPTPLPESSSDCVQSVDVNPKDYSTMLVIVHHQAHLYDLNSGHIMHSLNLEDSIFYNCKYSPNGRRVAIYGGQDRVDVYDVTDGMNLMKVFKLEQPLDFVEFVGWYNDTHMCAIYSSLDLSHGTRLAVINIDTGNRIELFEMNKYHDKVYVHPTLPLIVTYCEEPPDDTDDHGPLFHLWSY